MNREEIVKTLHLFEIKILNHLTSKPIQITDIDSTIGLTEAQTRSGINWLEGKNLIEKKDKVVKKKYSLSEKGKTYFQKELPEIAIQRFLESHTDVTINDLMGKLDVEKKDIGSSFGFLKKNSMITQDSSGKLFLSDTFIIDQFFRIQNLIRQFETTDELFEKDMTDDQLTTLKGALEIPFYKNIFRFKESDVYSYQITAEGIEIQSELKKSHVTGEEISQITPDILKEKSWKNKQFREYNIHLPGPHILIGKKNPYREYLDFLKHKFVCLGFREMRGNVVETEFWNMDALYMPQTHPARNIHDNYYIKEPKSAKKIPEPYYSNVAKTHENGSDTGSRGWGYKFNEKKAKQLILRSQGTVLSARTLANQPLIPGKYFSMARCFRYDKVDATHLADFFQIEGIVIGENVNFSTLLGLLELFAKEIAHAKEIKYVPGYFPFTEPSVEVHMKHPELGWFELGGSGIFRPEVTKPLGVDVPVLAWGLGIDRMAMMAMGYNDIRDLFSRDLDLIRETRMEL